MEKLSLIKRQILPLSNTDFFHTKNMGIFYHSFFIIAIFFSQKIAFFLRKNIIEKLMRPKKKSYMVLLI